MAEGRGGLRPPLPSPIFLSSPIYTSVDLIYEGSLKTWPVQENIFFSQIIFISQNSVPWTQYILWRDFLVHTS